VTRLLILWLLSERSMHGYQIKKSLTDHGMRFWFEVEDASIYSSLRTLVRLGYAVEAGIEAGETKRPRTKYAITASGRAHYRELLQRALADTPSFRSPIDVAMCAGGDLAPAEIASSLRARAANLADRIDALAGVSRSAPDPSLVDRHRAHLDVELAWTRAQL
jgi:DNA-binding PadR family transcriptional regulator